MLRKRSRVVFALHSRASGRAHCAMYTFGPIERVLCVCVLCPSSSTVYRSVRVPEVAASRATIHDAVFGVAR